MCPVSRRIARSRRPLFIPPERALGSGGLKNLLLQREDLLLQRAPEAFLAQCEEREKIRSLTGARNSEWEHGNPPLSEARRRQWMVGRETETGAKGGRLVCILDGGAS